jgi:hypothetical protein
MRRSGRARSRKRVQGSSAFFDYPPPAKLAQHLTDQAVHQAAALAGQQRCPIGSQWNRFVTKGARRAGSISATDQSGSRSVRFAYRGGFVREKPRPVG